jgi:hypothetical protein
LEKDAAYVVMMGFKDKLLRVGSAIVELLIRFVQDWTKEKQFFTDERIRQKIAKLKEEHFVHMNARNDQQKRQLSHKKKLLLEYTKLEEDSKLLKERIEHDKTSLETVFRENFAQQLFASNFNAGKYQVKLNESSCQGQPLSLQSLKGYQKMLPELLGNKAMIKIGAIAGFEAGSGKTGTALYACVVRWRQDLLQPILILVPNENLVQNWYEEAKTFFSSAPNEFTWESIKKETNTAVFQLKANDKNNKKLIIVIHKFTLLLPGFASKYFTANNAGFTTNQYVLSKLADNPNLGLSAAQIDMYTRKESDFVLAIMRELAPKCVIPKGGLVIVDEVQNLIDSSETIRQAPESSTILAWANVLTASREQVQKLFLTASFYDDAKPANTFKLFNMLKPESEERAFEGAWRASLSIEMARLNPALKKLYTELGVLETQHVKKEWANPSSSLRTRLGEMYGGLLFYMTLEHDPSVFPQAAQCTKECLMTWDTKESKAVIMKLDKTIPPHWAEKVIFVPLTNDQSKKLISDMKADAKQFNKPYDQLSYGLDAKKMRSSVYNSYGAKFVGSNGSQPAPKWDVVRKLMNHYAHDKFFVFSSAMDLLMIKGIENYFFAHGYQVVTMKSIFQMLQGSRTSVDTFWAIKRKRVLVYSGGKTWLASLSKTDRLKLSGTILSLWNDPRNDKGEYFQMLFGDRKTKEGISLFHTKHMIAMEEAANDTLRMQSRARIKRYCAFARFPKVNNVWPIQIWQLISTFTDMQMSKKDAPQKTNEEYLFWHRYDQQLNAASAITESLGNAITSISGDCYIYQHYTKLPSCGYPAIDIKNLDYKHGAPSTVGARKDTIEYYWNSNDGVLWLKLKRNEEPVVVTDNLQLIPKPAIPHSASKLKKMNWITIGPPGFKDMIIYALLRDEDAKQQMLKRFVGLDRIVQVLKFLSVGSITVDQTMIEQSDALVQRLSHEEREFLHRLLKSRFRARPDLKTALQKWADYHKLYKRMQIIKAELNKKK